MKKIVSLVVGVTALIGYVQAQEPLKIPDFIEYAPQDSFQVENTCVFGYDLDGNKESHRQKCLVLIWGTFAFFCTHF